MYPRNAEFFQTSANDCRLGDAATVCNRVGQVDADVPTVAERLAAGEDLASIEMRNDWLENHGVKPR